MVQIRVWVSHLGLHLGGFWVRFRWCLGLHLDWRLGGDWVDIWVGGCFDGSEGLFRCLLVLVVSFGDGCFGDGWVSLVDCFGDFILVFNIIK